MPKTRIALVIFVLAIAVRCAMLSQVPRDSVYTGAPNSQGFVSGDEGVNVGAALAMRGEFADPFGERTGPTAHVPPVFPAVTAVIFRVFGYGYTTAQVRNLVNIAGYALLFASFPAAAAMLGFRARAGVIAGLLAAAFPVFRSSEVFRGRDEWAAAFALLWLSVLVFRLSSGQTRRMRDVVMLGLGWGVALLVNPSLAPVLIVHVAIYFATARQARRALVVVASAVAIILPWTIRNYRQFGAWFYIRDNLGLELRCSYGDGAQPSLAATMQSGWYCHVHPMCSPTAVNDIRRLGEIEFNRRSLHAAVSWIKEHPARACQLILGRIGAFWADLPSNPLTFGVRVFWSVLGWLGLAMIIRARLRVQAQVIGAILAVYPLAYYLLQYSNRYVVAICFAVFLPAGVAIEQLWTRLVTRRPVPLYNHN